jgi:hypothetical protein
MNAKWSNSFNEYKIKYCNYGSAPYSHFEHVVSNASTSWSTWWLYVLIDNKHSCIFWNFGGIWNKLIFLSSIKRQHSISCISSSKHLTKIATWYKVSTAKQKSQIISKPCCICNNCYANNTLRPLLILVSNEIFAVKNHRANNFFILKSKLIHAIIAKWRWWSKK